MNNESRSGPLWVIKMINENPNYSELKKLIEDFYHFYSNNFSKFSHREFPKSCCEETSIVLNRFLKKNNINCFKLILGRTQEDDIHFWLESERYVIDLTAHQHKNINGPYYLIEKNAYPLFDLYSYDIEESEERLNTDYYLEFVNNFGDFLEQNFKSLF